MKNPFYYVICFLFYALIGCSSDSDETTLPTNPTTPTESNAIINIVSESVGALLFDERVVGRQSEQIVTIENTGNIPLDITDLKLPEGFTSDWTKTSIAPMGYQDITLTFSPTEARFFEGVMSIQSNAKSGIGTLMIQGQGVSEIYEGDVTLGSQQAIEEFALIGYTAITGDLCISANCGSPAESDIVSLAPLLGLTLVETFRIANNPQLQTLSGIENIKVGAYFSIVANTALRNIDAVAAMPFNVLPDGLSITGNESLENIDGLIKLNSSGGFITIAANASLQNIDGLANLISAKDVTINQNPLITHLNGLSKLELVQDDVTVIANKSLYGFCGIKLLLETGGLGREFRFTWGNRYNPTATDIVDGECSREIPLDTYHGEKRFLNQIILNEFLETGYTKIEGKAVIGSNFDTNDVTSIEALTNLLEITDGLVIQNNTELTSLAGLENLTKVTTISIVNNPKLDNYCGIVPLFQANGGITGTVEIMENFYNPTATDLEAGTCTGN